MHHVDEGSAKRNIGNAMKAAGWTLLGWDDGDDSHAAYWDGIAVEHPDYPGCVACVKLSQFCRQRHGGAAMFTTPKGWAWHIEHDGMIKGRGKGLSACAPYNDGKEAAKRLAAKIGLKCKQLSPTPERSDVPNVEGDAPHVVHDGDWTWVFCGFKPDSEQYKKLRHEMGGRATKKFKYGQDGWWWYFKTHRERSEFIPWLIDEEVAEVAEERERHELVFDDDNYAFTFDSHSLDEYPYRLFALYVRKGDENTIYSNGWKVQKRGVNGWMTLDSLNPEYRTRKEGLASLGLDGARQRLEDHTGHRIDLAGKPDDLPNSYNYVNQNSIEYAQRAALAEAEAVTETETVVLTAFDNGECFGYDGKEFGIWGPYEMIDGVRHTNGWTVWNNAVKNGPLPVIDQEYQGSGWQNLGDWSMKTSVGLAEEYFGVRIILITVAGVRDCADGWEDEYPRFNLVAKPKANPYQGQSEKKLRSALRKADKAVKAKHGLFDFGYDMAINDQGRALERIQGELEALQKERQQIVDALNGREVYVSKKAKEVVTMEQPYDNPKLVKQVARDWSPEDMRHLAERVEKRILFVNDKRLGTPTPYTACASIRHAGSGCFIGTGEGYTVGFDGGGMMNHVPGGMPFTYVSIDSGDFPFDNAAAAAKYLAWAAALESPAIVPETKRTVLVNGAGRDAHFDALRIARLETAMRQQDVEQNYTWGNAIELDAQVPVTPAAPVEEKEPEAAPVEEKVPSYIVLSFEKEEQRPGVTGGAGIVRYTSPDSPIFIICVYKTYKGEMFSTPWRIGLEEGAGLIGVTNQALKFSHLGDARDRLEKEIGTPVVIQENYPHVRDYPLLTPAIEKAITKEAEAQANRVAAALSAVNARKRLDMRIYTRGAQASLFNADDVKAYDEVSLYFETGGSKTVKRAAKKASKGVLIVALHRLGYAETLGILGAAWRIKIVKAAIRKIEKVENATNVHTPKMDPRPRPKFAVGDKVSRNWTKDTTIYSISADQYRDYDPTGWYYRVAGKYTKEADLTAI